MGAALSIFVLLSFSVFVTRIASVALRFTGLSDDSARFQALSAFTGTGFTTSEAETVVNYPVRRRIVSRLMFIGNLGLVTVFATMVVGLVSTEGEIGAVMVQMAWFLGGLVLLWIFLLNPASDRILCHLIGKYLNTTSFLGKRKFHRLVQVGNGLSLCEHPITRPDVDRPGSLKPSNLESLGLTLLAVHSGGGRVHTDLVSTSDLEVGDALVLFGADTAHEELGSATLVCEGG